MSAKRSYQIFCDYGGCRDMRRLDVPTLAEARKRARKEGWRTRKVETLGGDMVIKDRCPRHATLP